MQQSRDGHRDLRLEHDGDGRDDLRLYGERDDLLQVAEVSMLPLIKRLIYAFFLDELAFRRWMRGGMLAFAGGGLAFADQIGALLNAPGAVKGVKIAAVVCGFIAGAMQSSAKKQDAPAPQP
jgi:hypothetical protein